MKCHVYVLRRECGEPFYVGKGSGDRARQHVFEARRGIDYNPHKSRIIRKMLALGIEPTVDIVAHFESDEEAYRYEADLIAKIGRRNIGTGPLVNVTAGGEGVVGYPQTPEVREAKRRGALKRFARPDQLAWAGENMRSIHADQAAKERGQEAARLARATPEARAKASEACAGRWSDPVKRARMVEGQRKYAASEVGRQAARARHQALLDKGVRLRIKPVKVDGVEYPSLKDAAASIGMNYKALTMRFSRHAKADNFPEGWGYMDTAA